MRAILLPVKNFREAKTRLAGRYSPSVRAALAMALCEDFFRVIARVRGIERVFVVSQEPHALELARRNGWEAIVETAQISESHSVDAASRICAKQGVLAALRLPSDIPLAEANDIEAIFEQCEIGRFCALIPSRDGTGTNALLRSPPDLFPSHFGPNSFPLHLAEARACGARVRALRNARIELDIDEFDDLLALKGQVRPDSRTAQWIEENLHGATQQQQSAE